MATIRKQKVSGHTYWQIVESRRVNGKPRPFVIMHLGTTENLMYKLRGGEFKHQVSSLSHGAVWAMWKLSEQLNLRKIFSQTFSSQKRAGLSVGDILLLGALHRAIHPGSKRAFGDWARKTTLPQIISFDPAQVDSQAFWDQMDTVTESQIAQAEMKITKIMKEKNLLSPSLLYYDTTNFFTFIDSDNSRCTIAQRGKNKQKRNDLRQFGLRQIMTKEFLLPVCSQIYEGNSSDCTLFIPQITQLCRKFEELNYQLEDITIVFDKGNNSKGNFAELDKVNLPYVASLVASYHEDLISIPLWRYYNVAASHKNFRCFRVRKKIWGKERTIVLYLSETLRSGQVRSLNKVLAKKFHELEKLKNNLLSSRVKKRDRTTLIKTIENIIRGERGDLLIDYQLKKRRDGRFHLDWSLDRFAYSWLTETLFGKRLLVTCREDWSEAEIISAYHGQSHVERLFRNFKNPYHHAVRPQYHWTDQKIKVHTFICMIGLLLSQVLWKKACQKGHKLSIEKILDSLEEVRQVEMIYMNKSKGRPRKEKQLEEMESELKKLYEDLIE